MVEHIIVQAGQLLVPAAAAASRTSTTSRLLPIVIILGLLFMFSRLRTRGRRAADSRRGVPAARRSDPIRETAEEPTTTRESDTDPEARSDHTQAE